MLVAGANTAATLRLEDKEGQATLDLTLLNIIDFWLLQKNIQGKDATEDHLHRLQASRRLLSRVEAIHAISWLWPSDDAPSIGYAEEVVTCETKTASTPLKSVLLPVLRRKNVGGTVCHWLPC